jgi:hypothetical protein
MPQFYLAIGFAMQLTLGRLRAKNGIREVIIKQLRRSRTLYIIGLLVYNVSFQFQHTWANLGTNWPQLLLIPIWNKGLFQTLTIIATAQFIILPVMTRSVWIRGVNMGGRVGRRDPPGFENFVFLVNKIEKNYVFSDILVLNLCK